MTNLDKRITKQRYYFFYQSPYIQTYGFSSGLIQMWELDLEEGWVLKNWYFQTVVLEKSLDSPLDTKEIKPVNPKGNQPWIFIGRADAKAGAPVLWPPDLKSWLIGNNPDAVKYWRQEEKGMTEDKMVGWHHWLDGHDFEQTLGHSGGQGNLVCCSSWGLKELDTTDWTTKNELLSFTYVILKRITCFKCLFANYNSKTVMLMDWGISLGQYGMRHFACISSNVSDSPTCQRWQELGKFCDLLRQCSSFMAMEAAPKPHLSHSMKLWTLTTSTELHHPGSFQACNSKKGSKSHWFSFCWVFGFVLKNKKARIIAWRDYIFKFQVCILNNFQNYSYFQILVWQNSNYPTKGKLIL